MTSSEILSRLKAIRSKTHSTPILAVENDLSRLIAVLEREEQETESEWQAILSGATLTNTKETLTFRLERN